MGKAILNYTTSVDAARTVAEIQAILVKNGASRVTVEYEAARPVGVSFTLGGRDTYKLPARPGRVLAVLKGQLNAGKVRPRHATPEQAERVAWRILKDWLEAQLALIAADQVELGEVFFAYLFDGRRTAFEAYAEQRKLTGPA